MFKWLKKRIELDRQEAIVNSILEDLEIKNALDIVEKYYSNNKTGTIYYKRKDHIYYEFFNKHNDRNKKFTYPVIKLSKDFTLIKQEDEYWNIASVIDLSKNREKIKKEFKDLFDGLLLQHKSMIKLKKVMRNNLKELLINK